MPPLRFPLCGFIKTGARVAKLQVELESTVTCPGCGASRTETMPTDSCQWFYECANCKAILKPKPGDCCVFCSYGTVKCPPIQQGDSACC